MTVNKINKKIKSLVFLEEINEFKNWTRTPSTNPDRAHKAVNQTRFSRHGRIFIYCCLSGLLNAPIVLTRKKNKSQFLFFQTITAEDNGGKSNSATVNIKVEDVNDQSPEFVRACSSHVSTNPEFSICNCFIAKKLSLSFLSLDM